MTPRTFWIATATVYRKEWTDALRDKRTLAVVLASSVLLGPLVLIALSVYMATVEARAEQRQVVVAGIAAAPGLRNYLERQTYDVRAAPADYESALRDTRLDHPVIVVPPGFEAGLRRGEPQRVEVVGDSGNKRAEGEVDRAMRLIAGYGRERAAVGLALRGVAPELMEPIQVSERDLAGPRSRAAEVTGVLPFFVIMAMLVGALNAALDSTAGERERGALEPLLMNPVPRSALVGGKWAAVSSLGMVIAVLSCLSFLPAQRLFRSDTLQALFQFGWPEALRFLLVLLPLAATLSALLMAVAIRCRSFKEAQANTAVVTLGVSLLPLATAFNEGSSGPWQLWVPALAQYTLMTRVLKGETFDAAQTWIPLLVCTVVTAAALAAVVHVLKTKAVR